VIIFVIAWIICGLFGSYLYFRQFSDKNGYMEVKVDDIIIMFLLAALGFGGLIVGLLNNNDKVLFTIGRKDD